MPKKKRPSRRKPTSIKVTAEYNEPWGAFFNATDNKAKAKALVDLVLHHRDEIEKMSELRKEVYARVMKLKEVTKEVEPFLWQMLYLAANWRDEDKSEQEVLAHPEVAHYVEGWGRSGDAGILGIIDGEPIGAAWYRLFTKKEPGYGFVDTKTPEISMALRKRYRRAGLGRILLAGILALAKSEGYQKVSLSVEPDNRARKLYEKQGFEKVGENNGSWTMVRDLSSRQGKLR